MKLYVLYTSYPHEGGYVHGVFSSRESAEEYLNNEEDLKESRYSDSYISEIELDKYQFQEIEI